MNALVIICVTSFAAACIHMCIGCHAVFVRQKLRDASKKRCVTEPITVVW